MRSLLFALPLVLSACVDMNRGPELDDLVNLFLQEQQIAEDDLVECGPSERDTCEQDPTAHQEALACIEDAFATCTPAILQFIAANGDGVETRTVLVVHETEDGCAVERFVDAPEGGRRELSEASCGSLSVATDGCEAPDANECTEVCSGFEEDQCWWPN